MNLNQFTFSSFHPPPFAYSFKCVHLLNCDCWQNTECDWNFKICPSAFMLLTFWICSKYTPSVLPSFHHNKAINCPSIRLFNRIPSLRLTFSFSVPWLLLRPPLINHQLFFFSFSFRSPPENGPELRRSGHTGRIPGVLLYGRCHLPVPGRSRNDLLTRIKAIAQQRWFSFSLPGHWGETARNNDCTQGPTIIGNAFRALPRTRTAAAAASNASSDGTAALSPPELRGAGLLL